MAEHIGTWKPVIGCDTHRAYVINESAEVVASGIHVSEVDLIAASPLLLAACEAALAWMHKHCEKTPERFGGETVLVADLQLAIRAAKGGQ